MSGHSMSSWSLLYLREVHPVPVMLHPGASCALSPHSLISSISREDQDSGPVLSNGESRVALLWVIQGQHTILMLQVCVRARVCVRTLPTHREHLEGGPSGTLLPQRLTPHVAWWSILRADGKGQTLKASISFRPGSNPYGWEIFPPDTTWRDTDLGLSLEILFLAGNMQ